MAQQQGTRRRAARAARDAARWRDRAFNARLMPQLSLAGTLPTYNRAINPVSSRTARPCSVAQNADRRRTHG